MQIIIIDQMMAIRATGEGDVGDRLVAYYYLL